MMGRSKLSYGTLWKLSGTQYAIIIFLANISSPVEDPMSHIEYLDGNTLEVESCLLRHFCRNLRQPSQNHGALYIGALGFEKTPVRYFIRFLHGHEQPQSTWINDLNARAKVDLAMLAFHFAVHALQALLIESLARFLLDEGNCPNHAMLLHVWALSGAKDPLRRLFLASLYLHTIVLRSRFQIINPQSRLEIQDFGKGMWLDDFRRLLEPNMNYKQLNEVSSLRRWEDAWSPTITTTQSLWNRIATAVKTARDQEVLDDDDILFFVDPSGKSTLQARLCTVADHHYLLHNADEPMSMPAGLAVVLDDSEPDVEVSKSTKRKHRDVEPGTTEPAETSPIKRPRLSRTIDDKLDVQCSDGAVVVVRSVLAAVSEEAEKLLEKQPAIGKLSFSRVTKKEIIHFVDWTYNLKELERCVVTRVGFNAGTIINLLITAEQLGSPTRQSRLYALLTTELKKFSVGIPLAARVFELTKKDSKLRTLVAENLHWRMLKHGTNADGIFYTHYEAFETTCDDLHAALMKFEKVWGPKMQAAAEEATTAGKQKGKAVEGEKKRKVKVEEEEGGSVKVEDGEELAEEAEMAWARGHPCYGMAYGSDDFMVDC
jgi:hypothetical protein